MSPPFLESKRWLMIISCSSSVIVALISLLLFRSLAPLYKACIFQVALTSIPYSPWHSFFLQYGKFPFLALRSFSNPFNKVNYCAYNPCQGHDGTRSQKSQWNGNRNNDQIVDTIQCYQLQ